MKSGGRLLSFVLGVTVTLIAVHFFTTSVKFQARTKGVRPSISEGADGDQSRFGYISSESHGKGDEGKDEKNADETRDSPAPPREEHREASAPPTRSWFPESLLFEPLVVTDALGKADVAVTVPDRLTTWRVLALAHSREGAQAGSVTTFEGTLPVYVDPVVPTFVVAGDEIRLPIQLVNTTSSELPVTLDVHVVGAKLTNTSPIARLAAHSTGLAYVTVVAEHPGTVTLLTRLEGRDSISRQFPVLPSGRPITQERGGTLASARTMKIALPADAGSSATHARLEVFPGALALVRSETTAAGQRENDAAYALLLAGQAPTLLNQLGDSPDKDALRSLRLVATQQVLRAAPGENDPVGEAALLEAAAANDDAVLKRTVGWLAARLATEQHPDGSFAGQDGWTAQRLLVATADCVRALQLANPGARGVAVRAQGFFERQLALVKDGYTAAALLASGQVPTSMTETLRKLVSNSATSASIEGGRTLTIPEGITRADGRRPTEAEAAAMGVLALDEKEDAAIRAELGSTVLGSYRAESGWGDGAASSVALRAVVALFKEPLSTSVQVQLLVDGRVEATGTLDPRRTRDTLAVEASVAGLTGDHEWTVKADPPVPGLGFHLAVTGYGAWHPGRDLQVQLPDEMEVGVPADVVVAATQTGSPMRVHQPLPAGLQVHRPTLDALVSAGTIVSYEVSAEALELEIPSGPAGSTLTAQWRVVPTLAGTLHAAPAQLRVPGSSREVPCAVPAAWHVTSGAR